MLAGLLVVAASAALGLISSAILIFSGGLQQQFQGPDTGLPPGFAENFATVFGVNLIIFSVLGPFLWWAFVSLVMQLVTSFFGGEGPISGMFAAVGVAYLPFALSSLIGIPLSGVQVALGTGSEAATIVGLLASLISILFLIWHVVLVVIGAALARGIGYGESTGSCAISCAGCFGLIILVVVVLVAAGAIFAGGAAPQ